MLWKLLKDYSRPYRTPIYIVFALILAQTLANLSLPSLNADIINEGVAKGDTGYVLKVGGYMLLITVVLAVISVISIYYAAKSSMQMARDLRSDVFKQVLSFSPAEMDEFGTPSLITRNTNDIQQVQVLITVGLTMLVSAPITIIGGVIMAIRHNLALSSLIAVAIPIMVLIIAVVMKIAIPQFRIVQKRIDRINTVLREQISGVRVIRAFVRDDVERERFAVANTDLMDTQLRINRIFALSMPVLFFILNLATVGVVWFGGHLIADGNMQIGDITAFISYLMQILGSVMMATMMLILIPRAAASAERIAEVLNKHSNITSPASIKEFQEVGTIEFRDVTFSYPKAEVPVLENVSFKINRGETTAIIGGTGSGKTTLVNLMIRFLDPSSGSVMINGVDTREVEIENLWARIGYVPQRTFIFGDTVAKNVGLGAIDDSDTWQALRVAQADVFVEKLENNIETNVAQGGTDLSGGQKQRLSIARAIAKKPDIYIFDDCLSALDAATDAKLRAALTQETNNATVVIVAQRISSIRNADRILVIDEGRIVGNGTHHELLDNCATYSEIVDSQAELNV
jgi:ATP-binding cassette subfamily B multidrug efflux pump